MLGMDLFRGFVLPPVSDVNGLVAGLSPDQFGQFWMLATPAIVGLVLVLLVTWFGRIRDMLVGVPLIAVVVVGVQAFLANRAWMDIVGAVGTGERTVGELNKAGLNIGSDGTIAMPGINVNLDPASLKAAGSTAADDISNALTGGGSAKVDGTVLLDVMRPAFQSTCVRFMVLSLAAVVCVVLVGVILHAVRAARRRGGYASLKTY